MVIDKYGPADNLVWPCLLANGPHDEVIVGNNADSRSVKHLVVFDEQLDTYNKLHVVK